MYDIYFKLCTLVYKCGTHILFKVISDKKVTFLLVICLNPYSVSF